MLREGEVLLHGEHGAEEDFHLLLVYRPIIVSVNEQVHLVNLLIGQLEDGAGHLHDVLLDLVLI